MTTRREAALARFIASAARFIVFAAPFIVFAVGVLLLTAALKVLGPAYDWPYNLFFLAFFVVSVVWVGRRASWRPLAIVGAMLWLVILGFASILLSEAVSSMRPLVEVREDRVMADVRGLAADAGFTALVVPHRQSDFYMWPGELADPAGFTLAYGPFAWWSVDRGVSSDWPRVRGGPPVHGRGWPIRRGRPAHRARIEPGHP